MKLELYKEIRKYLKEIISNTKFEHMTYCVGGCCRDEILGNEIKDIDIVVELENGGIELAQYLYENHFTKGPIQTYPRFGTAMFKLRKYPNIEIECVHTRCEKYPDGNSRNPQTDYGNIHEDCYRRDLTINALYYNISDELFVDFCKKSIHDIKNHIIQTPTDPNITYIDDPLRILRCVRFSTRYQWKIEDNTYKALKENIDRLRILTQERITDEFCKILNSPNYIYGLNLLEDIDALKYILTPFDLHLKSSRAIPKLYVYSPSLMISPLLDNLYVKMVILLYPYSQYADQIMRLRKFSSNDNKYIFTIIKLCKKYEEVFDKEINDENIRRCQYDCQNKEKFNDFLKCLFVFRPYLYSKFNILDDKIHNHYEYKLPINGDDIMRILNIPPGEKVKKILNSLIRRSFKYPDQTIDDCIEYIKKGDF